MEESMCLQNLGPSSLGLPRSRCLWVGQNGAYVKRESTLLGWSRESLQLLLEPSSRLTVSKDLRAAELILLWSGCHRREAAHLCE